MEAALQAAIRARLVASSAITGIIPATAIVDRNATPALDNSIVIGEGQSEEDDGLALDRYVVYLDLHIWRKEAGTIGSKQVVDAIRSALKDGQLTASGLHVIDMRVASTRFLRDPGGLHSHAVMTLRTRVQETS